jgi:DNA-binding response OmpR family regulator
MPAILVVDDDESIRNLVKSLLEAARFAVLTASNGAAALALFRAARQQIALVLTDVAMPGMNGVELADRVLAIDNHLPVLFMSGSDVVDRGYGCVAKPFRGAELIARVHAALDCRLAV